MADFGGAKQAYVVRDVELQDTKALFTLYRQIEPDDPITPEAFERWWRWLYVDNPAAGQLTLGAFTPDGRAVAHVALLPFDYVVDRSIHPAGFPCQLMVAPALRQTLLYPTLVTRLLRGYRERGFDFCYAIVTRARVLKANVALGFKQGGTFPVYVRPYRLQNLLQQRIDSHARLLSPISAAIERLLRLRPPLRRAPGLETVEVGRFPPEAERVLADVSRCFKVTALRSVAIANWRFAGNTDRLYRIILARRAGELVGYAVVRCMAMKTLDTLALVDIGYDPYDLPTADALLHAVHRMAIEERVDVVATVLNPKSPYRSVLRRWGFIPTPESFTLITHEPRTGSTNLHERPFDEWHITWFDHDFV
jgi:hypothetical protein